MYLSYLGYIDIYGCISNIFLWIYRFIANFILTEKLFWYTRKSSKYFIKSKIRFLLFLLNTYFF